MKLSYFPDTDTLYIDISDCPPDRLRQRPSVESEVINENLIIDLDSDGQPVGITLEHYSKTASSQAIEVDLSISMLTNQQTA